MRQVFGRSRCRVRRALSLCALGALAAGTARGDGIVVEGRAVETKAEGPCLELLTTGTERYVDCGNGTVYDAHTGLLWLRDAACGQLGVGGFDDWEEARRDVEDLQHGLCGLSDRSQPGDWRLPTDGEWAETVHIARFLLDCTIGGGNGPPSLTDDSGESCFGDGSASSFVGVASVAYWSGDAYEDDPANAIVRDLVDGNGGFAAKSVAGGRGIWPVRDGGGPGAAGAIVIDGAVAETRADGPCFGSASFGSQRYVDCGNGTVLDLVTRLLWLGDASCSDLPGLTLGGWADWPTAMAAAAALGEGLCGLGDGSQPGDWRLPTPDEWTATTARAVALGCTVAGANDPPAFTDVSGTVCLSDGASAFLGVEGFYWTSAVSGANPDQARVGITASGVAGSDEKSGASFVWPVREHR